MVLETESPIRNVGFSLGKRSQTSTREAKGVSRSEESCIDCVNTCTKHTGGHTLFQLGLLVFQPNSSRVVIHTKSSFPFKLWPILNSFTIVDSARVEMLEVGGARWEIRKPGGTKLGDTPRLTCDISWHRPLEALMSIWPFHVRIKMRRHQARGPRSLQLDLPDLGQRLGSLTPRLLISGIWPFHWTGCMVVTRSESVHGDSSLTAPKCGSSVMIVTAHLVTEREPRHRPGAHRVRQAFCSGTVQVHGHDVPCASSLQSQCIGHCIPAQVNGCCIPTQVNGPCISVQVNGCCIPVQVNGCCIPGQVNGFCSLRKSMSTASLRKSMGIVSLNANSCSDATQDAS